MSGFRILVAAYAQALNQQTPLNPKDFVEKYAADRFGFSKTGSEKFRESLFADQGLIRKGEPVKSNSISDLQKETEKAKEILYSLSPERNQQEFEHFRLMIDLREFYLKFKRIKAIYNSANFSRDEAGKLIPQLEKLMEDSKKLDKRFYDLNKGFLHDKEIEEQNEFRRMDLENIYDRILVIRK